MLTRIFVLTGCLVSYTSGSLSPCGTKSGSPTLEYVVGDALIDSANCLGPEGTPYPIDEVRALLPKFREATSGSSRRQGRNFFGVQSPEETRKELLHLYSLTKTNKINQHLLVRSKRQAEGATNATVSNTTVTASDDNSDNKDKMTELKSTCTSSTPARLCKSTFNTTAPMYGVSLTSGKPVTIVQIFPDLLQQVVYETCDSKECDLIHGECVQTYVPYLFLVIPLGPVTLTGQDYVLVESGCSCRPKYAPPGSDPNPTAIIPNF